MKQKKKTKIGLGQKIEPKTIKAIRKGKQIWKLKNSQQTRSISVQGGEVGVTVKDKGTHKPYLSSPADIKLKITQLEQELEIWWDNVSNCAKQIKRRNKELRELRYEK
jgi:hypothetical protein